MHNTSIFQKKFYVYFNRYFKYRFVQNKNLGNG